MKEEEKIESFCLFAEGKLREISTASTTYILVIKRKKKQEILEIKLIARAWNRALEKTFKVTKRSKMVYVTIYSLYKEKVLVYSETNG